MTINGSRFSAEGDIYFCVRSALRCCQAHERKIARTYYDLAIFVLMGLRPGTVELGYNKVPETDKIALLYLSLF